MNMWQYPRGRPVALEGICHDKNPSANNCLNIHNQNCFSLITFSSLLVLYIDLTKETNFIPTLGISIRLKDTYCNNTIIYKFRAITEISSNNLHNITNVMNVQVNIKSNPIDARSTYCDASMM